MLAIQKLADFCGGLADPSEQCRVSVSLNSADDAGDLLLVGELCSGHKHVDVGVIGDDRHDVIRLQKVERTDCSFASLFNFLPLHRTGTIQHDRHINWRSLPFRLQMKTSQPDSHPRCLFLTSL